VLSLTWTQVDFNAAVVRLEENTTKKGKGRTFPFSALPDLATLLERQRAYTDAAERLQGSLRLP
jgi:hypothetical protein